MSIAVITIVRGRHHHLALQHAGLERSSTAPDVHIVVAMDDPSLVAPGSEAEWDQKVVHVPAVGGRLPLARARNVGARAAIHAGATTLVFLDVDCIPSPTLIGSYAAWASREPTQGDLLCGPVTYLTPPPPTGYNLDLLPELVSPHLARPCPAPGAVERSTENYELFWSLSFALTAATWSLIGGFDEAYVGYGGEDTDFARRAEATGTALAWIGDAHAFHQHHPVSSPPVEHVGDIVRNASVFYERWGEWPMRGWLDAFEARGLVGRSESGAYRVLAPSNT